MKINFFKAFLILAAIPLLAAYTAQYAFDMLPCKLCNYQRLPYIAIIIICAQALWRSKPIPAYNYSFILICIIVGISLAAFHLSIENGWIQHHSSCIFNSEGVNTFEQYKLMLESADLVSCEAHTPAFLGLSMVGWNLAYELFTMTCFMHLYKNRSLTNHI